MVDAARLADELRAEQDHASAQASSKQSLNNQFGSLRLAWLMLRTLLLVEARPPWPSWRTRFTSWRLSLPAHRLALVSPPRLTSALSASARSLPSLPVRTGRPTSPPSCSPRSRPTSSRSRRPRRSPPSTWPSLGRPSRSWRRLRSAPSLPRSSKLHRIRTRICQLKLEENLTKSGTRLCDNTPISVKNTEVVKMQAPDSRYVPVLPKPSPWKSFLVLSVIFKKFSAAAQSYSFCFFTYNKP